jgi:hypothetical protein
MAGRAAPEDAMPIQCSIRPVEHLLDAAEALDGVRQSASSRRYTGPSIELLRDDVEAIARPLNLTAVSAQRMSGVGLQYAQRGGDFEQSVIR